MQQVLQLQNLLTRQGYDVGKPDGKLGLTTRAAVKQAQLKLGLPADAPRPTPQVEPKRAPKQGQAQPRARNPNP